jgi:hypothetical protein
MVKILGSMKLGNNSNPICHGSGVGRTVEHKLLPAVKWQLKCVHNDVWMMNEQRLARILWSFLTDFGKCKQDGILERVDF